MGQLAQGYIRNNTINGKHVLYEADKNVTLTFVQLNNISTLNDVLDAVDVTVRLYIRYENDFVYISPGGSSTVEAADPMVTYENLHYELVEGNQIIAEVSHASLNVDKKLSFILQGE